MNRIKTQAVMLTLTGSLFMGACATLPPPPDISAFGAQPTNTEAAIKNYFETTLKDPDSARYRFEDGFIRVACTYATLGQTTPVVWRPYWARVALVNAKNSYGGYTGHQRFAVLFEGDTVVNAMLNDEFQFSGCRKLE